MAQPEAIDRLKSQLLTSGLQQTDNPLFQVINQLIGVVRDQAQLLQTLTGGGNGGGGGVAGGSFVTTNLDQGSYPNSRQILPGSGVTMMNDGTHLIVGSSPIPGFGEFEGEEGPMGPPGIQGPTGPASSGSGSAMPFYYDDPCDCVEYPALVTLMNQNSVPESAIIDGTILARVAANESITGQWIIANGVFSQESNTPQHVWKDNAAAADEKYYRILLSGSSFFIQAVNDAFSTANHAIRITRVGAQPILTLIYNALTLASQVSDTLTADQTAWAPTNWGYTNYYSITPNALRAVRGISAQTPGYLVFFLNLGANNIEFYAEDGAASAANRLYLPLGSMFSLVQYQIVGFIYDGLNSRWVKIFQS